MSVSKTNIEWLRVEWKKSYRSVKFGLFHFTSWNGASWNGTVQTLPSDNIPPIRPLWATQYLCKKATLCFHPCERTCIFWRAKKTGKAFATREWCVCLNETGKYSGCVRLASLGRPRCGVFYFFHDERGHMTPRSSWQKIKYATSGSTQGS